MPVNSSGKECDMFLQRSNFLWNNCCTSLPGVLLLAEWTRFPGSTSNPRWIALAGIKLGLPKWNSIFMEMPVCLTIDIIESFSGVLQHNSSWGCCMNFSKLFHEQLPAETHSNFCSLNKWKIPFQHMWKTYDSCNNEELSSFTKILPRPTHMQYT